MVISTLIVLKCLSLALAFYICIAMILAAAMAVYQEYKIWKPATLTSLSYYGCAKVFWFNIVWFVLCFIGTIIVLIKYTLMFGKSDLERDIHLIVEHKVARICHCIFVGRVKIVNEENLPDLYENNNGKIIPAPIYIANHASQIDVAAAYYIDRRFKWIAKQSVLYLPGVNGVMWLGNHVLIQRFGQKNRHSVSNLFAKSNTAVKSGISMFFFPQGTRRIAERLPFKDGAFIVAQDNKCTLVPMSIDVVLHGNNHNNNNNNNIWNSWYPLNLLWTSSKSVDYPTVTITVHKPIKVTGDEDRNELKQKCADIIYSALPPIPTKTTTKTTSNSKKDS